VRKHTHPSKSIMIIWSPVLVNSRLLVVLNTWWVLLCVVGLIDFGDYILSDIFSRRNWWWKVIFSIY